MGKLNSYSSEYNLNNLPRCLNLNIVSKYNLTFNIIKTQTLQGNNEYMGNVEKIS